MATDLELYGLHNDSELRNRVLIQCVIAAEAVMNEDGGTPNHANRLIWAASTFENPRTEADRMFIAVLAANKDASVEAIKGASEAQILTNVNDHIDLFATGLVV